MDYFKSYFLKNVMLFIVLFSLTTGCKEKRSALEMCEFGLDHFFGLETPLIICVRKALFEYKESVLPTDQIDQFSYTQDLNVYYWTMYKLVSAVKIELKEQFCGRLHEMIGLIHTNNLDSADCEANLASFEEKLHSNMVNLEDPISDREIISMAQMTQEDYDLKKLILYNALYYHKINYHIDERGMYSYENYEDAYLNEIADKIELIKDLQICEIGLERHFGLDTPLIACVRKALIQYRYFVLSLCPTRAYPYTKDVNVFYWTLYTYVSLVSIELKEQFCGRLSEMAELIHEANSNYSDCEAILRAFERDFPQRMIDFDDYTDYHQIYNEVMSLEEYEKKKRILYNALYHHDAVGNFRNGSYGAAYLTEMARQIELIDGNSQFTPREYCKDTHKQEQNDVGTSISS